MERGWRRQAAAIYVVNLVQVTMFAEIGKVFVRVFVELTYAITQ
jgi:hypothetical protein